jgi:hypothetical protein
MEILDDNLKEEYGQNLEGPTLVSTLPRRIVQREEMPKIIASFFEKLNDIKINGIPLIFKTFHNDTIIIDPKLTIEIINAALGINENTIFNFLYNMYFYSQDQILRKAFGDFIFIQVPSLIFTQTGPNRFQLDF